MRIGRRIGLEKASVIAPTLRRSECVVAVERLQIDPTRRARVPAVLRAALFWVLIRRMQRGLTSSFWRRATIGALFVGTIGCSSAMLTVPRTEWSVAARDQQLFDDLTQALRSQGYVLDTLDQDRGAIQFHALHRARVTEAVVFTIQCYQGGMFDLIPSGPRVESTEDGYRMPARVGQEYRELAAALTDSLHASSSHAGGSQ